MKIKTAGRLRAVSLFSLSVEQNARDKQMTTRATEGARRERRDKRESLFFLLGLRPSFLASRGFAAQRPRAGALPSLNLKKKRGCSQSKDLLTTSARGWLPRARRCSIFEKKKLNNVCVQVIGRLDVYKFNYIDEKEET